MVLAIWKKKMSTVGYVVMKSHVYKCLFRSRHTVGHFQLLSAPVKRAGAGSRSRDLVASQHPGALQAAQPPCCASLAMLEESSFPPGCRSFRFCSSSPCQPRALVCLWVPLSPHSTPSGISSRRTFLSSLEELPTSTSSSSSSCR